MVNYFQILKEANFMYNHFLTSEKGKCNYPSHLLYIQKGGYISMHSLGCCMDSFS